MAAKAIQQLQRPRRNRSESRLRDALVPRTLRPTQLVLPVFIMAGNNRSESIASLPGCSRITLDLAIQLAKRAEKAGILGLALFPVIADEYKNATGSFATDPNNILLQALPALRAAAPELLLITDVALDPYSSDGHDASARRWVIDNDVTLPLLADMAVAQAGWGRNGRHLI